MEQEQITIENKIIDFVLNIPIEKWKGLTTQINNTIILISENAYHTPIIIMNDTMSSKEITTKSLQIYNLKKKLEEKYEQDVDKENKIQLQYFYDILTCKHEEFVEMYHNSPDKELRCKKCKIKKAIIIKV